MLRLNQRYVLKDGFGQSPMHAQEDDNAWKKFQNTIEI